jgi:hypothetical protein
MPFALLGRKAARNSSDVETLRLDVRLVNAATGKLAAAVTLPPRGPTELASRFQRRNGRCVGAMALPCGRSVTISAKSEGRVLIAGLYRTP